MLGKKTLFEFVLILRRLKKKKEKKMKQQTIVYLDILKAAFAFGKYRPS